MTRRAANGQIPAQAPRRDPMVLNRIESDGAVIGLRDQTFPGSPGEAEGRRVEARQLLAVSAAFVTEMVGGDASAI